MRVLITGAGGFAGSHLVELLAQAGDEVVASDRTAPEGVPDGVESVALDVTDVDACWNLLTDAKPGAIYHLAGQSHVARAEADPAGCLAVNTGGTANVLQACLDGHANVRVLVVSSAEVYGRVAPDQLPVREDHPLRPATAYALSKAQAEMHVHRAAALGLHAVIARAFNHIGPRQSDDFVASAFAHQVARIEAGQQEPVLRVGNLDAVRDFSDVRDTVAAYRLCLAAGQPGEVFNVTSGEAVPVRQILDRLVELARCEIAVEQDPARMRPVDVPVFHGSPERLHERTGFRPTHTVADCLADVLDYWRASVERRPER